MTSTQSPWKGSCPMGKMPEYLVSTSSDYTNPQKLSFLKIENEFSVNNNVLLSLHCVLQNILGL